MKLLWCLFFYLNKRVSLVIPVGLQIENPSKVSAGVSGFPSSPEHSTEGLSVQTGGLLGQRGAQLTATGTVPTQALEELEENRPWQARSWIHGARLIHDVFFGSTCGLPFRALLLQGPHRCSKHRKQTLWCPAHDQEPPVLLPRNSEGPRSRACPQPGHRAPARPGVPPSNAGNKGVQNEGTSVQETALPSHPAGTQAVPLPPPHCPCQSWSPLPAPGPNRSCLAPYTHPQSDQDSFPVPAQVSQGRVSDVSLHKAIYSQCSNTEQPELVPPRRGPNQGTPGLLSPQECQSLPLPPEPLAPATSLAVPQPLCPLLCTVRASSQPLSWGSSHSQGSA